MPKRIKRKMKKHQLRGHKKPQVNRIAPPSGGGRVKISRPISVAPRLIKGKKIY